MNSERFGIRLTALAMVIIIIAMFAFPCSAFAKKKSTSVKDATTVNTSKSSKGNNGKQLGDREGDQIQQRNKTNNNGTDAAAPVSDNKSSLWSAEGNRKCIPLKKGLTTKKNLDTFISDIDKYTDRYRIISGTSLTEIDSTIPYSVSIVCYSLSKSLGKWSLMVTYYSQEAAFSILENGKKKDFNKTLWGQYSKFFSVKNGNFVTILGFVAIFLGLFGLFSLVRGRISEGFGRFAAIIAIFIIAIMLYGNAFEVMSSSVKIAKGISSALEASFNMDDSIGATGAQKSSDYSKNAKTYTLITDNMIVKPYNHLQYGSYDPLKKGEIMSNMPTMYNYFLTYTNDDKNYVWFGESDKKVNGEARNLIYGKPEDGTTRITEKTHKMVGARLANESNVLKKLDEWWDYTADPSETYTKFCDMYGKNGSVKKTTNLDSADDGSADRTTTITVGSKTYQFSKVYGTEGWSGKMGEAFLNLIMSIILFVVYFVIGAITFAGQIMVLFAMIFGLPVLIFGMFKGFEPVKKLIIVFIGGFACTIMSGIMRGMLSTFLSVFANIAGDNLVYQLFLVVVLLFVSAKLIKKFITSASQGTADGGRMALMRARMDAMRAGRAARMGEKVAHKAKEKGKGAIDGMKRAAGVGTWMASPKNDPSEYNGGLPKLQNPENNPESNDLNEKNKEEIKDDNLKSEEKPEDLNEEKDKEKLKEEESDDGFNKKDSANEEHKPEKISNEPNEIKKEETPNNANIDNKEEKEKTVQTNKIDESIKEDKAEIKEKTEVEKDVDEKIVESERSKDTTIDDKSVIDKVSDAEKDIGQKIKEKATIDKEVPKERLEKGTANN